MAAYAHGDGQPAVDVAGLSKRYGPTTALDELSLTVRPGEVFGLLGPNGAGKTTAIKILVGLVRPSAGEARIFGQPVADPATRRDVGYLPEHFRFPDWLTGEQVLHLHGRLAGLDRAQRRTRVTAVLEQVGLTDRADARLRAYSKGMAQRIGLAQALLARPRLVLLDEPTSALDPVGRRTVRDLVRGLRDEGAAVVLNSHLLSEVEMVCDRVAIVDRGRVRRAGRLTELVASSPQVHVTLDRVDESAQAALADHGDILDINATTVRLAVTDLSVAPVIAEDLVRAGYRLHALVPARPSLEDIFVDLVGRDAR